MALAAYKGSDENKVRQSDKNQVKSPAMVRMGIVTDMGQSEMDEGGILHTLFNPLSPDSDQHQISPCEINAFSTPEVM